MRVPLTLIDFLDRAELFGDRVLLVDKPGGPASLGRVSAADLVRRARGMARELDRLGVGHGARVAIVSPNSRPLRDRPVRRERLRPGPGAGQLPPQRRRDPLHRRALRRRPCCSSTPSSTRPSRTSRATHRIVLDGEQRRRAVRRIATSRRRRGSPTRTRPRRSTTPPARRPGPRACSSPTAASGSTPPRSAGTSGVSDRDVYLHTLPHVPLQRLGHALRASPRWAARQVILRKIDGEEILRRVERPGRHRSCAARRRCVERGPRRRAPARERGEPVPGHGRVRVVVAGRAAAVRDDRARRGPSSAGSSSRSTASPRPRRC